MLVCVQVDSQEVLHALVKIERECVVRNFMWISMLDGDDSVWHNMSANLLQLVDGDILEVQECEQTNFLALIRVGWSLALTFCSLFTGIHQHRSHNSHHVKVLLVLCQVGNIQSMLVNHFRIQTLKAAHFTFAAIVQSFFNFSDREFQRGLRIVLVELVVFFFGFLKCWMQLGICLERVLISPYLLLSWFQCLAIHFRVWQGRRIQFHFLHLSKAAFKLNLCPVNTARFYPQEEYRRNYIWDLLAGEIEIFCDFRQFRSLFTFLWFSSRSLFTRTFSIRLNFLHLNLIFAQFSPRTFPSINIFLSSWLIALAFHRSNATLSPRETAPKHVTLISRLRVLTDVFCDFRTLQLTSFNYYFTHTRLTLEEWVTSNRQSTEH